MKDFFTVNRDFTQSDRFIDMPVPAQVLYFHLCSQAKDGYVYNVKSTMRGLNLSEWSLKVLLENKFLEFCEPNVYRLIGY